MIRIKNSTYRGSNNRLALYDLTIPVDFNGHLVVFIHGYMGFKDWGAWNKLSDFFTDNCFGFSKFNLTHNGTTIDAPYDFKDLDAFASNTYSKEVADVGYFLDHLSQEFKTLPTIHFLGHSRGGGIAFLNGNDSRVTSIITLAAISSIHTRFSDKKMLEQWKKEGVRYVTNQRTHQQMPHNYEQYLDFLENKEKLSIEQITISLHKPTLIIHGSEDISVSITEGEELSEWTATPLVKIEHTDHVFGAKHPWNKNYLPAPLKFACEKISEFILEIDSTRSIHKKMIEQMIDLTKKNPDKNTKEIPFIVQLIEQMGLTKNDVLQLFNSHIKTQLPPKETDRILQFYRLCLLTLIDEKITFEELSKLRDVGINMGLSPTATEEIIRSLQENKGKVLSPEQLIKIFKVNLN
jgi:pimeloyl-ACP methyl ester carboxylesterase